MSCFLRTRVRGSVTPLMYGREANDLRDSDASTILKNVPTSSSGDNTVERRVLLAWMFLNSFIFLKTFNTRKKEHLRNVKTAAKGSRIANHVWANSHAIDFDNASIIDKGGFRTRKILEAWHSKRAKQTSNLQVGWWVCEACF